MAKKKSNKINPFILILIYACLLFAVYSSLSTLVLGICGETTMGVLTSYDNRRDNAKAEVYRSRTIFKGYNFTVDGKEYKGYVMYMSDEAWPRLKEGEVRTERISYLAGFPYINKPAMLTDFDQIGASGVVYYFLTIPGCVFLFLWVTGRLGKKKRAVKKTAATRKNTTKSDHDIFCQSCGTRLPEGAAFCISCGAAIQKPAPGICTSCGAKLPESAAFCISCGAAVDAGKAELPQAPASAPPRQDAVSSSLIGFSDRCNDPEILAAAKSNRKSSIGCMLILVLVPLIGFPIAGLLMEDFPLWEAVVIGVGIALVMLIVNLFGLRSAKKPVWEGVVVNKYSKERRKYRRTSDGSDPYTNYMEYTTVVHTDRGNKKQIVERDSERDMFDYLSVGDRVRYHPTFGTYEKYDKSKDRIIYCNICRMMNPIKNDRCKRCNNLLFK